MAMFCVYASDEPDRTLVDPGLGFAKEAAHNAEMAKLYAQHVLKEQPTLQIQGLGGKKKASQPAEVLHKPIV